MSSAPAVVVFDFDGTLVSRDSFFDFALGYCLRRPARLLAVGAVLPLAMLLVLRSRAAAGSVVLWAMTVGSSTRAFVRALRSYATGTLPRYANEQSSRNWRDTFRREVACEAEQLVRQRGSEPTCPTTARIVDVAVAQESHCVREITVRVSC